MKPDIIPNPEEDLKIKEPAKYAAGALAVQKAIEHLNSEMGPVRAWQAINKMNKKEGFDCPGCAWPDPDDKRSVLGEYCENGAKALAEEGTTQSLNSDFFATHSLSEMRLWSEYRIGKSGRLSTPLMINRDSDHYTEISWDKAYEIISNTLLSTDNPNQSSFYTSGRTSNEAAFLYSLFVRQLGTNNLPDCSNLCHESSGVALGETLGIGKGSVSLKDFDQAEIIMILGQNPGTNHPRMLSALQKAKLNGTKIIVFNPLEEAGLKAFKNPQRVEDYFTSGTQITDIYCQTRINQDIPLLKAIIKTLIEDEAKGQAFVDKAFIQEFTVHYEKLVESLNQYNTDELVQQSGIDLKKFEEVMSLLRPAKKIIVCWAMGLTQHENAVDNIKEVVNLLLLKGSIGIPGGGTCPVRGHSNVQGDRSVGIKTTISPQQADRLSKHFGIDIPREKGFDAIETVLALEDGRVENFFSLGGNFLSAMPDTNRVASALQKSKLTVSISTKLNRTHLYPGEIGIILPTYGRSEIIDNFPSTEFYSTEDSTGKVRKTKGVLPAISSNLEAESDIIAHLGIRIFGAESKIPWKDYVGAPQKIRQEISSVIEAFKDCDKKLRQQEEYYLPNNARSRDFSKLPEGKAVFTVCDLPKFTIGEGEFTMMSIRSHDQYNTTIYGHDDRYRGVFGGRRVIFANPQDMNRLGLQKGDLVHVFSSYDDKTLKAHNFKMVPYNLPIGNLAAYFPEINPVIPLTRFARHSRTPISKSFQVSLEKAE